MRGYAKIKENNPFFQRSKSKKENPFLDQNLHTKNSQENDQKPNIFEDDNNKIYKDLFQGKTEDTKSKVLGGVLRRNLSVSASSTSLGYQKNGKSSNLERQSSKRVIQEAVKRAFSMRRCSSVNNSNSDRYCRIYDQPKNVEDSDYIYDDYGNHDDDGFEKNKKIKNKDDYDHDYSNNNSGKKHVGSKVVKVCKRLFSR